MEEQSVSLECHSRKDKFHFLRVPKGFDIAQLDGVPFDPDQTIELGAKQDKNGVVTTFELGSVPCQSMDWTPLVKSDNGIKLGPLFRNYFVVTKSIQVESSEKDSNDSSMNHIPNGFIGLPEGLRERFTPFGYDCPVSPRKGKSPKKKKKKKHSSDICPSPVRQQSTQDVEDHSRGDDDNRSRKKKRKRSLEDESFLNGDSSLNKSSEESIHNGKSHHSKKKKRKKDKD